MEKHSTKAILTDARLTVASTFFGNKSIISILIGIAVDRGEIQSVNQKVLDFFPDFRLKITTKGKQRYGI